MKCPNCRSKDITIVDRWIRQCQKCGHRWSVTRHPERITRPEHQEEQQP